MKSESINELAAALSKAQGQMKGAEKTAANPFFKSKYADLASVWDACRKPLSDNGLAVIQTLDNSGGMTSLITTLAHTSGQWVDSCLSVKPVKDDPQGMGSAITYARRYALSAIVGIAPEDDDGNAASGKQKQQEKPSNDALAETSARHREFVLKNLPVAKSVAVYANNINNWRDSGEMTEADYGILKEAITKKHAELTKKEDK